MKKITGTFVILFFLINSFAQSVAINTTGAIANSSAIIDISSTSKGMLIPRMTAAQKTAVATPATGLLIYQTDGTAGFYYYDGSSWIQLSTAGSNFWQANGNHIYNSNAGNVGIGITSPLARLHVEDSSVLFSAAGTWPATPGPPPVTGPGRRTMWYPDKVAFRTGYVNNNEWDKDSIGLFSFASGVNNVASGQQSTTMGSGNRASGTTSIAFGTGNNISGFNAIGIGNQNRATQQDALALGYKNYSTSGNSIAIGYQNQTSSFYGISLGTYLMSKYYAGVVLGIYNDTANAVSQGSNSLNRIFQIGNGTADNARSNAMTVLHSGDVGIGTVTPSARLHVADSSVLFSATGDVPVIKKNTPINGAGRRMMWYADKGAFRMGYVSGAAWDSANIGTYSFSSGFNSNASGSASFAGGLNSGASGASSIAYGNNSLATGLHSAAFGYRAFALSDGAFAAGWSNTASAAYSSGLGINSVAAGIASFASGDNDSAMGNSSISLGFHSRALDDYTVAMGFFPIASGQGSVSIGFGTTASGSTSTAIGINNVASGSESNAMGSNTFAVGTRSFTTGFATFATGTLSTSMGFFTRSKSYGGMVVGTFNDSTNAANPNGFDNNNRLFQIGNGTADNARSNAMTVLQNGNVGIGVLVPGQQLSVATGMNIDENNSNSGTTSNTLRFGSASGEAIGSKRTAGGNQNGLDFYTNFTTKMSISNAGNVGIGTTSPVVPLQFANSGGNKIAFFQNGSNYYGIGTQASLLQLFTPTAADDIAFGYGNSGAFTENIRMDGSGSLAVRTNLTVQNGKGIIRNTDGTQSKKLSASVTVNATFSAGQTQVFSFAWPEAFSAVPEAWVANATGAGGWAEVVLSVANVSTTGATLYVFNPRTVSASPNFTVKIVAIGAQ